MNALYSAPVLTGYGEKRIDVYNCDILAFDEEIDILTTSAYISSYSPVPRTMFAALFSAGINVGMLAAFPEIDLRKFCHAWLSKEIAHSRIRVNRIGCVEFGRYNNEAFLEQAIITTIASYFQMLDIAATNGVKMETVALPLLASGRQNISSGFTMLPIINECVAFLKRNSSVKRICFIERSLEKASFISNSLQNSYSLLSQRKNETAPKQTVSTEKEPYAFISYSSADRNIADNLCNKLENRGVKVWYAPRNVAGPYAAAITEAIEKATHFVLILSQNSIQSEHVLNEIDLAFQNLPDKIKFKPLRIDNAEFTPALKYYISRQHWMDATHNPLEDRLNEFVESLLLDL